VKGFDSVEVEMMKGGAVRGEYCRDDGRICVLEVRRPKVGPCQVRQGDVVIGESLEEIKSRIDGAAFDFEMLQTREVWCGLGEEIVFLGRADVGEGERLERTEVRRVEP
jgi:hypothetical protein